VVPLLVVFAVAASLAACAGDDDDADEATGSASTSEASQATEAPTATTEGSTATTAGTTEGTAGTTEETTGTTEGTEGSDAVEIGDWGGTINPGGEPQEGGTLRIDQGDSPESVSSLYYLSDPNNQTGLIVQQIFSQLVEYVPGELDPQPGLAESWEVSDDGLTYTFHLRDATFSDGTPVTSADVKWVFEAAQGGVDLDGAGNESFFADQYAPIDTIETPDDKTVIMTFETPYPAFIYFAAYLAVSIVPHELVEEMGVEAFNEHPVGSGPFVLDSWTRDQQVTLTANENYWGEGPYLDGAVFNVVPDDNTRALNLESGTVDVADRIAFSQVERINQGDAAQVLVVDGSDVNALWLNNSKPPFDEDNVRIALNYATPVDSIVDVVFQGLARRMNTIVPKLKYWTDEVQPYPYDPDKARELLAQTSVPDGFSTSIAYVSTDQASAQEAQIIQDAWADIGVEVTLEPLDAATQGDLFSSGEYEAILHEPGVFTSDVPVDDQFAQLLFDYPAINNLFSFYDSPPELKTLVRQALRENDEDRRVEEFTEIHRLSMADPMFVPLTYTPNRVGVANNVHNFSVPLTAIFRLEPVWIDQG
jgi:peptide/nickel transport system substrate-binding protein